MINTNPIYKSAREVLNANWRRDHTIPAEQLYPHQWLWDSCFTAIGLVHFNPQRAITELLTVIGGQWKTGMLPHMIYAANTPEYDLWQSDKCEHSPNIKTSTITQPPIIGFATWYVTEQLPEHMKKPFVSNMLPSLIQYHEWLYRNRDPKGGGLVTIIHPWEDGLDNTPPWSQQIMEVRDPWWVTFLLKSGLSQFGKRFRRDTKTIPAAQRTTNQEGLRALGLARTIRETSCGFETNFAALPLMIQSVTFNSILVASNEALIKLAQEFGEALPPRLLANMNRTKTNLDDLCDNDSGYFFSYDYKNQKSIEIPTISTFLPLFSGAIGKPSAAQLVKLLRTKKLFWPRYPVPSAPLGSAHFSAQRYWQGPTWVNTNWMIITGLQNYGYKKEADELTRHTLEMVEKSGFREYFSPNTAKGYGAENFSWSAALAIDLLSRGY